MGSQMRDEGLCDFTREFWGLSRIAKELNKAI